MEKDFTYAHNDTSSPERVSATAQFNVPKLGDGLKEIRRNAFANSVPVCDDETLCFLGTLLYALKPKRILELGTAVGAFSAYAAQICTSAHITTIERDENFFAQAKANFASFGVADRVTAICGDAGEVIKTLSDKFDFIFMDCAKVQYVKYLPDLKNLLEKGGVLAADDVLLYGYVTGEVETPKKRRMLVEHIREYINAVTSDGELDTTIINTGDGIALSVKI